MLLKGGAHSSPGQLCLLTFSMSSDSSLYAAPVWRFCAPAAGGATLAGKLLAEGSYLHQAQLRRAASLGAAFGENLLTFPQRTFPPNWGSASAAGWRC